MSAAPLLVIETSVETGSVALVCAEGEMRSLDFHAGRKPSATLWPALEQLLMEVTEVSAVVVGLGPGSYNGARVGIAAAQGIALVKDCEVVGLSSFEGVALVGGSALAIGDARRGSFSLQRMVNHRRSGETALVDKETLVMRIEEERGRGGEVFCFEDVSRFSLPSDLTDFVKRRQSRASQLGWAYFQRTQSEREELGSELVEPCYLRAPHITKGKRSSLMG